MPWRTKVSGASHVEHRTRAEADARIDEFRRRYQAGVRTIRIVRLYDPEGGVRLVDFAAEARDAARALGQVQRATAARDRAIREATQRWETVVARALSLGRTVEEVAAAAGISPRHVRAILVADLERRGGVPSSGRTRRGR